MKSRKLASWSLYKWSASPCLCHRQSRNDAPKIWVPIVALLIVIAFTAQAQNARQLVTYTLQSPVETESGKPFDISVVFVIQPEWYIYAPTGINAAKGMIETKVTFILPEDIKRSGKMKIPEPIYKDGFEVLKGKYVTMRQPLMAQNPGRYEIKGRILYQSCSTDVCLPPVIEEFVAIVNVR